MKRTALFLTALAIGAASAACSSTEKNSGPSTPSEILGVSQPNEEEVRAAGETAVTLGITVYSPDVVELVNRFNDSGSRYKVIIKDYSDPDKTVIDTQNAMKIDIIAGHAPDMILCEDSSFYSILLDKGVFADISGIFDDAGVLTGIRTICTEDNGEIYRIPTGFSVRTAYTSAENGAGSCEIFDYQAMMAVTESLAPDEVLTWGTMDAEDCTRYSLICDFTDMKRKTCNFDSPDFVQALEFYRLTRVGKHSDTEYTKPRITYTILCNAPSISHIRTSGLGDDVVLTPPKHCRAILAESLTVSAFAGDDQREGAEEFLRFALADENVNTRTPVWFPITETGLDMALDVTCPDLDENGEKVERGLSAEDKAIYRDYLRAVDKENVCDRTVMGIFQEETEAYVNGACTAEQCAAYIQNRASIYLSEQS